MSQSQWFLYETKNESEYLRRNIYILSQGGAGLVHTQFIGSPGSEWNGSAAAAAETDHQSALRLRRGSRQPQLPVKHLKPNMISM